MRNFARSHFAWRAPELTLEPASEMRKIGEPAPVGDFAYRARKALWGL